MRYGDPGYRQAMEARRTGIGYDPGLYGEEEPTAQPTTGMRTVSRAQIKPTGGVTTSYFQPKGAAPELGAYPKFAPPEWSEEEITALTQKKAAAPVRRLREAVQRAMGQYYENPAVKSMSLREALAGYGMGLESAMAGAGRAATGEYEARYGREYATAQTQWQADIDRVQKAYETAWQKWLTEGRQVTETKATYARPEEKEGIYGSEYTTISPGFRKPTGVKYKW